MDLFAHSLHGFEDICFEELRVFLSDPKYHYEKVHIQFGGHGIAGWGGNDTTCSKEDFKKGYERIVKMVLEVCTDITIAATTHAVLLADKKTPDKSINDIICERNRVAFEIADQYGLKKNDLYGYMLSEGAAFNHTDRWHFCHESDEFIAKRVAEVLGLKCTV